MRPLFSIRRLFGPLLLILFLTCSLLPGTAEAAQTSAKIALNDPCYTIGITCHPPLIYNQGPVQHHPKIYLIFWGPKWNTSDPTVNAIEQLFLTLPGGVYNALLMQYHDTFDYIHNDVQVMGTWMDPQVPSASGIDVTGGSNSIYSEMQNALVANPSWQVTGDAQFMVFPQAGTIINTQKECGRHEWSVAIHANYYYSYVDTGGKTKADGTTCPIDPDSITAETTHEYAETATDPQASTQSLFNGSGWTTIDNNAGEIGDLCEDYSATYVKYSANVISLLNQPEIQELWDNRAPGGQGCSAGVTNAAEYLTGGFVGDKHTVQGSIWNTYTSGSYTSVLGLPVSEQEQIAGGFASYFAGQVCKGGYTEPENSETSGSAIYAAAAASYNMSGGKAYEVQGCNYTLYTSQMGGPAGPLGFPVSNEEALAGGHVSYFGGQVCNAGYKVPDTGNTSGSAIFYNGTSYEMQGCIYSLYMNQIGGPASIGFPVSNEEAIANGRVSYLAGGGGKQCNGGYKVPDTGNLSGAAIFYNAGSAYEVQGCIYTVYMNSPYSGPAGFGFPVSNEEALAGGRVSYFAGRQCNGGYKVPDTGKISGDAIFYNAGSTYEVESCIYNLYMNQLGGPGGALGFPAGNQYSSAGGGRNWNTSDFTKNVCGSGYPDPFSKKTSGSAIFQYGSNSAYEVQGCIYTKYMSIGGPASSLGLPTSNEHTINSANDRESDFQNGYIRWIKATGAIITHLNS